MGYHCNVAGAALANKLAKANTLSSLGGYDFGHYDQ
jgi:hypothetical protein